MDSAKNYLWKVEKVNFWHLFENSETQTPKLTFLGAELLLNEKEELTDSGNFDNSCEGYKCFIFIPENVTNILYNRYIEDMEWGKSNITTKVPFMKIKTIKL